MLSKTVACVLGPALLVVLWWKTGALRRRQVALVAPLIGIGAGLGLLTAWLERAYAGAAGAEWALSFADRCIIAGRSLVFYLHSLIWPGERVFMPPRWQVDSGAPAIVNAVYNAVGVWITDMPLTRDKLIAALKGA